MARTLAYIRSLTGRTEGQQAADIDLDRQRDKLTRFAAHNRCPISETFEDPHWCSGTPLADRPGGKRLIAAMGRGDRILLAEFEAAIPSRLDQFELLVRAKKLGAALFQFTDGREVSNEFAGGKHWARLVADATFEKDRRREQQALAEKYQRDVAAAAKAMLASMGWIHRSEVDAEVSAAVRQTLAEHGYKPVYDDDEEAENEDGDGSEDAEDADTDEGCDGKAEHAGGGEAPAVEVARDLRQHPNPRPTAVRWERPTAPATNRGAVATPEPAADMPAAAPAAKPKRERPYRPRTDGDKVRRNATIRQRRGKAKATKAAKQPQQEPA